MGKSYASAHEKHLAFVSLCKKVYDNTLDEDFKAVVEFYKKISYPCYATIFFGNK